MFGGFSGGRVRSEAEEDGAATAIPASNLELFARMYAVSRDRGREPRDAARRASGPLKRVFYSDHEWELTDIFDSCGHTQAVLERRDEHGYPVCRTVTLTELRGV